MTTYAMALDEYRFVFEVLGLDKVSSLPGYESASVDTVEQVLAEAGKFTTSVLFPLNRQSDEIGAKFDSGVVTAPPGFKEAYRSFVDAGWPALSGPEEFGGQGLPLILNYCLNEMISATCISFAQYVGLTHGAAVTIEAHGDDAMRRVYLDKLVSAEWGGTMCLTEPHAGTDLGLLRTKASPHSDGTYSVNGTKIFITAGEHDLVENIVHLVLAKLPDAPPGVKGISLFLVPKFLPAADGSIGERNKVHCGSIEHKMGMKGSVACTMNFEGAKGWLIGEPHMGLRAMFTMMNTARLLVSASGQGIAEVAYQSAAAYAKDRLQGRGLTKVHAPERAADPIVVHPDVRRMLLTMRAHSEGSRALGLWVISHADIAKKHPDPDVRRDADAFVALMTPVVKVWLSDIGSEAADLGVQVFGGHGYIREWGMEQLIRDIRILRLYEGANGIQALDLVGRKLPMDGGKMLRHFVNPIQAFVSANRDDSSRVEFVRPVEQSLSRLDRATKTMLQLSQKDMEELGAASMDYLKIVGYCAQSYLWARMAIGAQDRAVRSPKFSKMKIDTARFFFAKMLPMADAHLAALQAGGASVMAPANDEF